MATWSRPLTRARIETWACRSNFWPPLSPSHEGADRNAALAAGIETLEGRPLTRARIETVSFAGLILNWRVALSRGRGSKHDDPVVVRVAHRVALSRGRGSKQVDVRLWRRARRSPSHEGADRNNEARWDMSPALGRPLTRARIETMPTICRTSSYCVALSRGRGSKRGGSRRTIHGTLSPSHEGADRNAPAPPTRQRGARRPLTRARIET